MQDNPTDTPATPDPLAPTVAERRQALTQVRDAVAQRGRQLSLQIATMQADLEAVRARHAAVCDELKTLDGG